VNFCGAFARTDVMAGGVVKAWKELRPNVPVFFSIHGTGEAEAIALVRGQLGIEPYEFMEDAISAAVQAAQ
jgi:succinyl-CoA synthetase beta subunit